MGEKTALTHAKLLGERADRKTFQALRRSDVHGARQNGFASAETLGLAAEHGFIDPLFDKRLAGTRAKSARHKITVTQSTNKNERSFTVICSSA